MADDFKFKRVKFPARRTVFSEGEEGDLVYLITKGEIEIWKGTLGENPQSLGKRGSGEVIGEAALLTNRRRMASAVTVTDVEAIAISKSEFRKKVEDMDPVMKGIVMNLIGRVRGLSSKVLTKRVEVNWTDWKKDK